MPIKTKCGHAVLAVCLRLGRLGFTVAGRTWGFLGRCGSSSDGTHCAGRALIVQNKTCRQGWPLQHSTRACCGEPAWKDKPANTEAYQEHTPLSSDTCRLHCHTKHTSTLARIHTHPHKHTRTHAYIHTYTHAHPPRHYKHTLTQTHTCPARRGVLPHHHLLNAFQQI